LKTNVLVAAAFIDSGTVTKCTLTGINYCYSFLWAMSLSIIDKIASRLGIIAQKGFATAIKK